MDKNAGTPNIVIYDNTTKLIGIIIFIGDIKTLYP